jgi:nitrate reductase (cytochrome), electron transfer subunit
MEKSDHKIGKLFIVFAGIIILVLPIIIFQGLSAQTNDTVAQLNNAPVLDFDHNAKQLYSTYDDTPPAYMSGTFTSRTLDYYYSLRQYPGSPPFIPHDLMDEDRAQASTSTMETNCLSCHLEGGFAQTMNRFTPLTPHPQHSACNQCHVQAKDNTLFKGIDWVSVLPPKLGLSALGGSPPPVAHPLQMRENCISCHVGPGTVVPLRVEHSMRGNCRQCHVPVETQTLFSRNPTHNSK